MRSFLIACCAAVCTLSAHAAPPTKAAPSPNISIRTANDLANACAAKVTDRASFARLNFCNGFAQGILQTNSQNQSGTKICLPSPAPKRSETMTEFATWVRSDPSRRVQVASVAFLKFMAERFRCTKGAVPEPVPATK